jgi:ABC-type cobalamin/Fe3+-siderophores transport system ATPase subunit
MRDVTGASIATLLALGVLIGFFSFIPVVFGFAFMPVVYLGFPKKIRYIYLTSSVILGLCFIFLVITSNNSYRAFDSIINLFNRGNINYMYYAFLVYQPVTFMLMGIYGGMGTTMIIFKFIYDMCFTKHDNLRRIKSGTQLDKYSNEIDKKQFKKVDIKKDNIGISYTDLNPINVTAKMLNRMLFAIGTNGAGKTVLLRNLYARSILFNKACIVVDGKPDRKNIEFLKDLAEKKGVPFYGFNCGNNLGYDFLNNGTPTEIKDKIIGLKNAKDWDSDYYKTQAETYLQTAVDILKKVKGTITLEDVIDCFDFEHLSELLPADIDERTKKKLSRIKDIEMKDLKGIQNQLTLLADSDLGDWLSSGSENEFTLLEAIEKGGFVYFALPSLKYPSFASVLGKVVVNDLKGALYDKSEDTAVYAFFDEFGVFAGDQVLNLVNQGRGLGLHGAFGAQSIADLSNSAGEQFAEMFMGNMNSIALMRVNDNKSTRYLTEWVGVDKVREYQAHLNSKLDDSGVVKMVDEDIISSSEMQRLEDGDAYFITKVGGFKVDKMRVNFIDIDNKNLEL